MARDIDDLDFNTLRNKILKIIGDGSGTYGYGQTSQSASVAESDIITKAQWDGLRYDIINILIHQTGVTPNVIEISKNDVIGEEAEDPLTAYDRKIEQATANRFDLSPSQSLVRTITTKTFTSAWSSLASMTLQTTFASADDARYFYNSGGKIRFTSSRSGGSSTSQNNAWTNVLAQAGVVEFGAVIPDNLGFYSLKDFYQVIHQSTLSTPYSANRYIIDALCNVADNSTGTATSVTFRIRWLDSYTDINEPAYLPNDSVDGTLTLIAEEVKAAGTLQPSPPNSPGSFSITDPNYVISNISAS